MKKGIYILAHEEVSGLVNTAQELMERFRHGLPKNTEIFGSDPIQLDTLEIPRRIEVRNSRKELHLPKTKLDGLYRLLNTKEFTNKK